MAVARRDEPAGSAGVRAAGGVGDAAARVRPTRTTGLVTLPGAFVGSLAGGASPLDAARFQLAVLAGLLAAQAVAAVLLLHLLAPELAVAPTDR